MKKFLLSLIFTMLLCLFPCAVYAGPLDAMTEMQEAEKELSFSVTSGIDLSKEMQSTFDSSRTISGIAEQGTEVEIYVSTMDASGEVNAGDCYGMAVGASGLFSQTIQLGIGENIVEIVASKENYEPVCQSTILKRKKKEIKEELEKTISIPGSKRVSFFVAQ